MSLVFILIYVGPPIILSALGAVSLYLTFTGFFPGRTHIGWAFLGVTMAVLLTFVVWHSGTGEVTPATYGNFFYVLFLLIFLIPQGPLIVELLSLAAIPDPSKGLKPLKVHTDAERKVVEDDLPGAIAEYERIIAEDPEDIEARFRLAELCCEDEQYPKATAVYKALLECAKDLSISQHCSALTRLSEIHARHLGDVHTARSYIETIIQKYPDTKFAAYAKDRIDNL